MSPIYSLIQKYHPSLDLEKAKLLSKKSQYLLKSMLLKIFPKYGNTSFTIENSTKILRKFCKKFDFYQNK